jgi:hypothetical protein
MFGSELCVFFDHDYLLSFFDRNDEWERLETRSSPVPFGLALPTGFEATGYNFMSSEDGSGEPFDYCAQWWSIREVSI